jgi:hypothetical protein
MGRSVKGSMGNSRVVGTLRLSPLVWLLALGACTSVLGIEDLHEEPRDGSAGDTNGATAGNDSTGGKNTTGGKNNAGGSVNTDAGVGNEPTGGTSGAGGTNPTAGSAPIAGAPDGGAGLGGAPNPDDPTVRGHLIDFWGHKLANAPVQIGDTLVSTDENGAFTIENVPATYEVSTAFELDTNGFPRYFGWVFQGLTRRDPTLQVIRGLSIRYGNVLVSPKNATPAANQKISVAIGGKDGNTLFGSVSAAGVDSSATWEGEDTSQMTAHGLFFAYDANSELPTSYFSYNTSLVALAETGKANIQLDLTKGTLDDGNLQGTATTGGGSYRENQAFLHFTTGASMRLLDEAPAPNTFTYKVPSVTGSTITVAASEGTDSYLGPYGIVHANGLSATSKPALKIPTPPTLSSPASNITNVTAATKFTFQSPASNPGPFVVQFANDDQNGPYQYLWVVTASKQVTIPEVVGGGFALQPGQVHYWNVATHGKFTDVDAMTSPKGFLDPLGVNGDDSGPTNSDGEFTISATRGFTTAP